MVSVPPENKVIGLGHHYYVMAQVMQGTSESFIRRSSYILSDICDELNLKCRSVDDKFFVNPPGVTSFATLEESSLVLHTYFENDNLVTFDLTVDIPGSDPRYVYGAFMTAITNAVVNQTGVYPTILKGHWFDRSSGPDLQQF